MTPSRQPHRRLYPFEGLAIANFLLIWAVMSRVNHLVPLTLPVTLVSLVPTLAVYAIVGVIVRLLVAWRTGSVRAYLRHVRTSGWILDTFRLVVAGALASHTYFWIKLMMPYLHRRLFDAQLWEIDRMLFFGLSPNILFLNIFSEPHVLQAIDWSYGRLFLASMTIAFTFFLSDPSRRVRVAFLTGIMVLWLGGAWLYVAVPALGPAFRFPEVWFEYTKWLGTTQQLQALLMQNFNRVLALGSGRLPEPQLILGIAAFPSLHIGFQMYAFLWMRRLWTYGGIVFGVLALIIAIGSVVTGWHYLIDGVAGALLAAIAYVTGSRIHHFRRFRHLRSIVNG